MPRSFVLLALLVAPGALAQRAAAPDSARGPVREYEAAPVVVTATRSERARPDVPVPTTVVTEKAIRAQAPLRLTDLLAEQPGLGLYEGPTGGVGLQLQGFSPDYTLILLDGEPIIGRQAGTLDLNRLATAGLERVEIVRGPTSSRYGSDALAGVVNLITKPVGDGWSGRLGARAETHGTSAFTLEGSTGGERAGLRVLLDRTATDGYDLLPDAPGASAPAYTDYTGEVRTRWQPSDRVRLGVTTRLHEQRQVTTLPLGAVLYDERIDQQDVSVAPTARLRLTDRLHLDADLYGAAYRNGIRVTEPETGDPFEVTEYTQGYGKGEATVSYLPSARVGVFTGGGAVYESVGGDRYGANTETWQGFAFAEGQFKPRTWLDVNASARYDATQDFASRLTPKLAVLVRPSQRVRLRASVGSGFKAPAFRQRYLVFENDAGGGYSVYGAAEARARLAMLAAAGGIADTLIAFDRVGALRAENSVAFHAGTEVDFGRGLNVRLDLFRHNVRDLIETQAVAVKTNGQNVFTYFNLDRIYTQGLEAEVGYALRPEVRVQASYQWLDTADRDALAAIDAGTVYRRDAQNRDVRVRRSDYGGLFGRSRHSGTVRLDATRGRTTGSLRVVWRSRFGDRDVNGNLLLDEAREYVRGHATLGATLTQRVGRVDVQAGARNLLNYTDPTRQPGLAGRVLFVGASVRL